MLTEEPVPGTVPGACDERVAVVGFEKGHDWMKVSYYVPDTSRSVPLYCRRCGENGWRIRRDR